ncbi:MAG: ScaI family restriction endonuclease [Tepidisphaeraceae bacterium]|jgi:hypothetical protein
MKDPYPRDPSKWPATTEILLAKFPLQMPKLVETVLASWEDIFHSRIGAKGFQIGREVWPEPQILGFLLHELIPLNLAATYPGQWQRGGPGECDVVHRLQDGWSFEIKTSSSARGIFGNRSYAHISPLARKRRGSFFLAVNFEKFAHETSARPEIRLVRFGWLSSTDWIGQRAPSGQQARLTKEAKAYKLRIIYDQSRK